MTAAASWAGPLARRPAGKRRKARPVSPWRRLVRKTGRRAAVASFGITAAGAATNFLLVAIIGVALVGLSIFVAVRW